MFSSNLFLPMILSLLLLQEKVAMGASDLDKDKQALLDFVVPHGLGWKPADPICSSWAGVTCNSDRSRVIELRLSGFGLCGSIPENTTIGRLDALETLHLENNFLTGPLPSGLVDLLPRLKCLNLSNNDFSGPVPPSLTKRFPPTSFGGNPSLTASGLPPPEVAIPRLSSSSSSSSSWPWGSKKKSKKNKSEFWDVVLGRVGGMLAVLGAVIIFSLVCSEGGVFENYEAAILNR